MANTLIEHRTLSLEARMALIYLLSKPEDWRLQIDDLRRVLGTGERPCGRDKAYAKVNELKAAGYIRVERELRQGRFNRLIYYIFDQPEVDAPVASDVWSAGKTQNPAVPDPVDHCAKDRALGTTPPPFPEKPDPVAPDPAAPDPINPHITKEGKKPNTDSPPDPPTLKRRNGGSTEPLERISFDRFWEEWPKESRPKNRRFFERMFKSLTPAERRQASEFAALHRVKSANYAHSAPMIPYLKERQFSEFDGAPPLDAGHFVITPDREEWDAWISNLRTCVRV